jgi:hypothetical protein
MFFDKVDLSLQEPIIIDDLHGYVLPHAGTKYTGGIISDTLRFRPSKPFHKVLILYYPASDSPDIDNTYFHEYYVPWKSMEYIFQDPKIKFEGYKLERKLSYKNYNTNISNLRRKNNTNTLIVVSADFSHHLPFKEAIELENKAAHMIMFNKLNDDYSVIDDIKSFRLLYKLTDCFAQWVGRTRSPGEKGVGYLSFLLRDTIIDTFKVDGIFVTIFSEDMVSHECLGEWFDKSRPLTFDIQSKLIEKVYLSGFNNSRLTNGSYKNAKLTYFTITYLYKELSSTQFIRGWHGVRHDAFYLPDVFLENTFENGAWITPNTREWVTTKKNVKFNMTETLKKLNSKAGNYNINTNTNNSYTLYKSKVKHFRINPSSHMYEEI